MLQFTLTHHLWIIIKNYKVPLVKRLIPFDLFAVVDVLNLYITHINDFLKGIKVFDRHGDDQLGIITIKIANKDVGWQKKSKLEKYLWTLSFKTMAIIVSCSFFIHMNVKEFKTKIHLIKF